jgi:hypothetical protein
MTTILVIAILISLGQFSDFLLGSRGNRNIKDRLEKFYFSIELGDWSLLYRFPANALLRFIYKLTGSRILSLRFALKTIIISIIMTALFLISYLTFVYIQAVVHHHTDKCPAPPFLMTFVGVPVYLSGVLRDVFCANAVFDILTWSVTIVGLRIVNTSVAPFKSLLTILITILLCVALIHVLSALYLPISLAHGLANYNVPFFLKDYLQFFRNELFENPFQQEFSFRSFITVGCYLPPAHPFGISVIALTQFAALEALLPVILFVLTCLLGTIVYVTRPFTRKPVSLVVERLASSNNACATVASLLSGALAVIKLLNGSAH